MHIARIEDDDEPINVSSFPGDLAPGWSVLLEMESGDLALGIHLAAKIPMKEGTNILAQKLVSKHAIACMCLTTHTSRGDLALTPCALSHSMCTVSTPLLVQWLLS